jgi:hypothetical protein
MYIKKKKMIKYGLNSSGTKHEPAYEHGNEFPISIKCQEILDYLSSNWNQEGILFLK